MMDILQYEFMVRAFIAGFIISIICPFIGVFLVLRRLSFMADTLAHISLAGVATGIVAGQNPLLMTVAFSLAAAFGIERLRSDKKILGETVLALIMSGGMALAIVLISLSKGFNIDLFGYLFGSILTVSYLDLLLILGIGVIVFLALVLFFNSFFLITFQEETARTSGLAVERLNLFFSFLVALTVSIAMKVVGVLLVSSLMVIPVITGMQICKSFKQLTFLAIFFGLTSTFTGIFISYTLNLATGGAIVLTLVGVFTLIFISQKAKVAVYKKMFRHQNNINSTNSKV